MDLGISCDSVSRINNLFHNNFSIKRKIQNLQKTPYKDSKCSYTTSNNAMQEGTMTMDSETIQISLIKIDDLKLKFIKPFFLKYSYDGKYYQYEYTSLNYFGMAETIEEMIEQFNEDIYSDWMVYVESNNVKLSKRAEILKNKLLLMLEKVN